MITLRGVKKKFGRVVAVAGVDLKVEEGEILTLLGPSGSGKSTLLRMIAGFETPDEGTVILDGRDVTDVPPHERDVHTVFQSYALFPHLSVADNVGFGLKMKGIPAPQRKARVEAALAQVKIGGLGRRRPDQLSGGQRQRVALARALVCEPKVLLLDEPLSALDAKLRQAMQVELKRLQREVGITFVYVTHDQESALVLSDRIAVIQDGRIEQIGRAAEVYERPRSAFVASFLGETNLVPATIGKRSGGRCRVKLAQGIDLSLPEDHVPTGLTSGLAAIRPEKIHVERDEFEIDGTFTAVVEDEIFRGPVAELFLMTDAGLRVTALMPSRTADRDVPQKGERVRWWVHADDVTVVEDVTSPK